MAFSESLTVRILGDSSGLRQELSGVLDQIEDLQRRLSEATSAGQRFGNAFGRLSAAIRPLQQVSQLLDQIARKMGEISGQPLTLNVQPALQSLQQLLQMIQAVAAQLQALNGLGPALGGPAGFPPGPVRGRVPRGMASGGLVAGPSGIDRVPARLSAGEFVLRRSAVQVLGQSFLDRVNRDPAGVVRAGGGEPSAARLERGFASPLPTINLDRQDRRRAMEFGSAAVPGGTFRFSLPAPMLPDDQRGPASPSGRFLFGPQRPPFFREPSAGEPRTSSQTTNHFGGITIQLRDAAEVDTLIRDLRHQGITLRNRRG